LFYFNPLTIRTTIGNQKVYQTLLAFKETWLVENDSGNMYIIDFQNINQAILAAYGIENDIALTNS